MKKLLFSFCLAVGVVASAFGQVASANKGSKASSTSSKGVTGAEGSYKTKWTVNPFDRQVFIQNLGQFDTVVHDKSKVLFATQLGDNVFAYFTSTGIVYRYQKFVRPEGDGDAADDPDARGPVLPVVKYFYSLWDSPNSAVDVKAELKQSDYYTYPISSNKSIKVNIFKKITYFNLYPGIDVEYSFLSGKEGFKSTIIVHPGADISALKIRYKNSSGLNMDAHGNCIINGELGAFTDHAPTGFYKEDNNSVNISYKTAGATESFAADPSYDKTKTLVIDPWTTNPLFSTLNGAWDLDYDNLGNVYAYGNSGTYQLIKINSVGTKLWTFNATTISTGYYGDFAVDKFTGTSYCTEGYQFSGARSMKVNTNGTLLATFPGNASLAEMWRDEFNSCNHTIVVAGGGTSSSFQASILDTSMVSITPVNVLSAATALHDMCLIAMDPSGANAYMATSRSVVYPTVFDNQLLKLPVPSLAPTTYMVNDGYAFIEVGSISYPGGVTNGMNGMAASNNWLYMYDGANLKRVNKNTGALVTTVAVTGTSFQWGGLDVDVCDNVYAGDQSSVKVYNSALALTATLPMSNTTFDVVLGANDTILYTCGTGYVTATKIAAPPVTITKTRTPAGCGCNGTATATLNECGVPVVAGITYTWSNGQTTQTATGLCAGTYTITINQGGCGGTPFTDTVLIKPSAGGLTVNVTQTNVACFGGATGSATATPVGGTAPFTYSWAPSGGTNATATGLTAGTYTVTVNDAAACSGTASVTITQPPQLTVTTTVIPSTCNSANGGATATAGGGTPGYTYNWAPSGGTNANATNLSAGTYTITVTDAHGCTATATATIIPSPPSLTASTSTTPAACGSSTGSATVTAAGGTPGYTYNWTPIGGTNANATGLSAGSYTITVTDANGCTVTATAIVNNTGGETVSFTGVTNVSCFGGANGAINTNTVGGTAPYTYAWTPAGGTNANATGLSAGSYTVTVTDANGCVSAATTTVTQPPVLTVTTGPIVNVSCNGGANGSIGSGPGGGTPAYTYSWSNGDVNPTATGLSAGTYTITITDANGCTVSSSATVTEPPVLTATIGAPTNVTCNGGANGSATVAAGGGTPNYAYSWSNGNTNAANNGLSAGTYNVTVTDNNGCTATATVTITEPPALTLATASATAFCNQPDGSANVTAAGGTPGYTYQWNNGNTTSAINNIGPGNYNVTVTDANGCSTTATVTVANTPGETVNITATVNASCNGSSDGSLNSGVAGGTAPYTYSWSNAQTNANATGLSAGSYTLTVTDSHGCQAIVIGNVGQPAPLTVNAATAQTICIGQSATISANPGGGTPAYTYAWAPGGGTSQTITVNPAATTTYTVTITDANNCGPVTATVTITVNPPLSVVMGPPQSICPGGMATITATAAGGDGSYNYLWAPGGGTGSSIVVSPATTTTYTVTVTDNCGTPAVTDSVKVIVNPPPVVNFKADTLDGCSPLCISFTDLSTISSGTITNWAWNFGNGNTSNSQNPTSCYPNPGVYTVSLEVTSNNGCKAYDTIKNMITAYSHPVAAFTMSPQPTTIQDPLINFTDLSTDNYGIVAWQWNFGDNTDNTSTQQNPSHTYGDTGTYCANLTVTNKYGCTDSVTNCLVIQPGFSIYIPSAFSPNGDGINDVFLAKGTFINNFKMYIFDRWGMQLYYSEDINNGWPGTVQGQICQEDTYVYMIVCFDNKGNKHSYIGRVSLIK